MLTEVFKAYSRGRVGADQLARDETGRDAHHGAQETQHESFANDKFQLWKWLAPIG